MTGAPATTLRLDGEYGLPEATVLAQLLRDAVISGATVRVDTTDLSSTHVSTLQLLVAAFRTAEGIGAALSVTVPPDGALAAAMARCGLTDAVIDGGLWTGLSTPPAARSAA